MSNSGSKKPKEKINDRQSVVIEDPALLGRYYIVIDTDNFSLYRKLPSGWQPLAEGHYSTLAGAINRAIRLLVLEEINSSMIGQKVTLTLPEYLAILSEITDRVTSAIQK